MPRFKGRARRWRKKFQRLRWRDHKKALLSRGWVEVAENTLVIPSDAHLYPPFTPTHLGGKIKYGEYKKRNKPRRDIPRRSVMRQLSKIARSLGFTPRQYLSGTLD